MSIDIAAEVDDLLRMRAAGAYHDDDFWLQLLEYSGTVGVGRLATALPDDVRTAFIQWSREHFDNDVPVEQFLFVSNSRADFPNKHETIGVLRRWLKSLEPTRPE